MSSPQQSERAATVSSTRGGCGTEVKDLGLTELYSSKTPEADIIFVHGSGGSPRKSWVYKGNLRRDPANKAYIRSVVDRLVKRGSREPVFWPADILPQDHQDVRVMTYGYQSNDRKLLSRSMNKLTISQHGNQFLESIARSRHGARGRPIIFVAHGRGGLIVKQAIVESKKQKKQKLPELHDIYESFHGVVFLGTPHRGPEDAIRSLKPAGISSEVELEKRISTASKTSRPEKRSKLNELYNDFCDIVIEEEVIRVSNFQESKRKGRILATRKKGVSDYFSTFGVRDWERTDVINADRTNMCRFPNREDDGYDKVRNAIGFHLSTKRSKANDGLGRDLSLALSGNGENMPNWRESNTSTIIFDNKGLSRECKEAILQWFHRLAPSTTQLRLRDANLRKLEKGTGNWFLGLKELDNWLSEPLPNQNSTANRMLWLTGDPGAGKSILSCILIEYLEQVSITTTFGFAWFICRVEEPQVGATLALSITRTLLRQLLKQEISFPASVFRIYKKYEAYDGEEPEPLEDECLELLKSVVAKLTKVYVVIDGLDELNHGARVHAIKAIEALLLSGAYCVITSRTGEPDIEHSFSKCATRLKIGASEPDIWTYLENNISKPGPLAKVISANGQRFREEIISAILQKSEGMILLAQRSLNELTSENTLGGLETAIARLSSNLDDLYEYTWDRIKRSTSKKVLSRVQQVLLWVAIAPRPLKVPELRHALAIEDDREEFNPKALWDTPLDESSLGLIVIDEDQTVRFCHSSAHAYFEAQKFPNGNEILATTCLRYLLLNSLSPGDSPTVEDIAHRAEMYPFLSYAFENWHAHATKEITPVIQSLALRFLQDNAKVTTSYQLFRYTCYGEDASMTGFTGMDLVSSFDLREFRQFVRPRLESEVDFDTADSVSESSRHSVAEVDEEDGHEETENEVMEDELEEEGKEDGRSDLNQEEEVQEQKTETVEILPPLQNPEPDVNSLEFDSKAPPRDVEEPVARDLNQEISEKEKAVESGGEECDVKETPEGEEFQKQNAAEERVLIGCDTGEDTVVIHPELPSRESGNIDVQKAIRDFLVGEGKLPARDDHDGVETPGESTGAQSPPRELPLEGVFEGSLENSPENNMQTPPQTPKSGLQGPIKIPFPHDDTQAEDAQTPERQATLSLIAEHKLSNPHMRTVTPTFKPPSIFAGRHYKAPSASLKDRIGALPLYLTPVGEREDVMMRQYSSNSLPGGKGTGARSTSTSTLESHELDAVLTLPKRNMYLYPAARNRYDAMFYGGRSG